MADFQEFNRVVYGLVDDRLFSLWDLAAQQQRFTMRALKGIRKGDKERIILNLMIAFSFLNALSRRIHINIEEEVWKRFPAVCSYCGKAPCVCKKTKRTKRLKVRANGALRPESMADFQAMFKKIYPPESRTLDHAGVHLAEEIGEVGEAIHNFLGQHKAKQFDDIRFEIADYVSCLFGVANSLNVNLAERLALLFKNNCHVCHKAPCSCTFTTISQAST